MSIKDVARAAGVSTATVSHVINNSRFVSAETRACVLDAIERCNYYPNAHARSLASGRSQMLGLLISDITNPFFPELVKSIEAAAYEHGYDVVLSNTNYESERTSHYVRRLIERKVVGVALMTSELDMALVDELASKHVSVVFLDLDAPGANMSNLCIEYELGIDEAVRHLAALGHKRLAFISGPARLRSAIKRRDAFMRSVRAHLPDAPKPVILEGDFKLEGGRRAAQQLLAARQRPTAVMAANDMMAFGAMQAFQAAGLQLPADISLIGFDDIAFAALSNPPLTTIRLPRAELGQRAVEALLATFEHPERMGVELRVPTFLVERSSTAPVAAQRKASAGKAQSRKAREGHAQPARSARDARTRTTRGRQV
jgi:DNA-binding LacI/PurR family transcriptional regulator